MSPPASRSAGSKGGYGVIETQGLGQLEVGAGPTQDELEPRRRLGHFRGCHLETEREGERERETPALLPLPSCLLPVFPTEQI